MSALILRPEAGIFPTANFPELKRNAGTNWVDLTLDYDQTTEEAAYWYAELPDGVSFTGASIDIFSRQAAAVAGTLGWKITTITRADAEAFDTAGATDTLAAATVKGTAGQVFKQTVALTVTGWAAGELLLIKIARDVANDNVAEDAKMIGATIRLT